MNSTNSILLFHGVSLPVGICEKAGIIIYIHSRLLPNLNRQLNLMKQLAALFVVTMAGAIYKCPASHKAAPYHTLRKDLATGKVLHAMMQALNLQECIIWIMADLHAAVSGLAHGQHHCTLQMDASPA